MATQQYTASPSGHIDIDPISLHDLTDLPTNSTITADDILPILRARFLDGLPYTAISPRLLISVNPQQFIQANSEAVLMDWGAEYRDCGLEGMRGTMEPHLWGISGRAYYYMRRTGQDQTIVVT